MHAEVCSQQGAPLSLINVGSLRLDACCSLASHMLVDWPHHTLAHLARSLTDWWEQLISGAPPHEVMALLLAAAIEQRLTREAVPAALPRNLIIGIKNMIGAADVLRRQQLWWRCTVRRAHDVVGLLPAAFVFHLLFRA